MMDQNGFLLAEIPGGMARISQSMGLGLTRRAGGAASWAVDGRGEEGSDTSEVTARSRVSTLGSCV